MKDVSPFEFLEIIAEIPRYVGHQTQWTDYPSARKPRADLVLRLEEIAEWTTIMLDHGLSVKGREMPHANKSARNLGNHIDRLKLTSSEFQKLRHDVETHFAEDYRTFGYTRSSDSQS